MLGNKHRAPKPDVTNAPESHSENTIADEYLRMSKKYIQEDYYGEEVSEVDNTLKAGGNEGEGITRGQEI